MTSVPADVALVATRASLHRVAEHLLAATRKRLTGEITLVVVPGGFGTPSLPDGTALSVVGDELVVDDPSGVRRGRLTTLAAAAELAGVPGGFPWRSHPPATAYEPDEPLRIDPEVAQRLAAWFALGQEALTVLVGELAAEGPSAPQLFPEHFDLGVTAGAVNYGFSPGDEAIPVPYVYVGPHQQPPSDPVWNAPFGAYRTWDAVSTADDALAFVRSVRAVLLPD